MVRILQAAKDQINAHFIAQKWLWMCKQQQLKLCGTQLQSSKQFSAKIFRGCVDKWRIQLLSKKKKNYTAIAKYSSLVKMWNEKKTTTNYLKWQMYQLPLCILIIVTHEYVTKLCSTAVAQPENVMKCQSKQFSYTKASSKHMPASNVCIRITRIRIKT